MIVVLKTCDGRLLVTDKVGIGPSGADDLREVIAKALDNGVEMESYDDLIDDESQYVELIDRPYVLIGSNLGWED